MKIVCLDAATLGDADFSEFEKIGEFVKYDLSDKNDIINRLKDADVAMVNKIILDENILKNTNLKLILETATGTNNIDMEYAKNNNIIVKNVAGYSTQSVAQHTFALVFSLLNNTIFFNQYCQNGKWCESKIFTCFDRVNEDLENKNWGIIGLGTIGKQVANIAKIFGANVSYYSTSGKNDNKDFKNISLEELLSTSDIISIHAPLNDKTKNLIDEKELNLMKNKAIIINVGRGGIINEVALAKAIDEKQIKAGIDVLEIEPMIKNHPFLNIKNKENLILSPHIAFASKESMQRLINKTLDNLKEFIKDHQC